jgi:hypothetical protein
MGADSPDVGDHGVDIDERNDGVGRHRGRGARVGGER